MKALRLALISLILAAVAIISATQDPSEERVVARAANLDIRQAVKGLFEALGVSYSLDPDVLGRVTFDFEDATFEVVLQTMLTQVNATYRCEGGIYHIVPRGSESEEPANEDLPAVDITKVDCRTALLKVFDSLQMRVVIDPGVKGRLTYRAKPTSRKQLLEGVTASIGCISLRERGGRTRISRSTGTGQGFFDLVENLPYYQTRFLVEDDFYYYITKNRLQKVNASDGKSVAVVTLQRQFTTAASFDMGKNEDRQRLIALVKEADLELEIAPEEKDVIRIELGPATAAHLRWCISRSIGIPEADGLFLRSVSDCVSMNLYDLKPIGIRTFAAPEIEPGEVLLQVDSGRWRYHVRRDDLSIVKTEARPVK